MTDYKISSDNDSVALQRQKRDGTYTDIVRVHNTSDGRIAIVDKVTYQSYKFKGGIFLLGDTAYIAKICGKLQVYKYPSNRDLHPVIMSESYNRYSLASAKFKQGLDADKIELDYGGIVNNMLEYIDEL